MAVLDSERDLGREPPERADVAVVGSGLAGLAAALAAQADGAEVVILTRCELGTSTNSELASGGLAAVTGIDPEDSPAQHLADMERAAHGLMFDDVAETFVAEAGSAITKLQELGACFAGTADGPSLYFAPGHSRARSIRCQGGGTANLMGPLVQRVRERGIAAVTGATVTDILRDGAGHVCELLYFDAQGTQRRLVVGSVVLACGGLGRLYPLTSNTPHASGSGYYLALKAGAVLTDLEFVQFTPTSLAHPPEVRGISTGGGLLAQEGVKLLNVAGERFMPGYDGRAEAATRDIVARAIHREVKEGRGTEHNAVYVDMSAADRAAVAQVSGRFLRAMERIGIDPYATYVEVAPDVHFSMGGVAIDANGWTGIPGLYAAGEITAGLHGATRLNSNGLTEAAVFGFRAGERAAQDARGPRDGAVTVPGGETVEIFIAEDPRGKEPSEPERWIRLPAEHAAGTGGREAAETLQEELRQVMARGAGIERDADSVGVALAEHRDLAPRLEALAREIADPAILFETQAMYVLSRLILEAVRLRPESRGAHFRTDCPQTSEEWRRHICFALSA